MSSSHSPQVSSPVVGWVCLHCHAETGKGLPQTVATKLEEQNHLECHCTSLYKLYSWHYALVQVAYPPNPGSWVGLADGDRDLSAQRTHFHCSSVQYRQALCHFTPALHRMFDTRHQVFEVMC
jgi:hypothetical protein